MLNFIFEHIVASFCFLIGAIFIITKITWINDGSDSEIVGMTETEKEASSLDAMTIKEWKEMKEKGKNIFGIYRKKDDSGEYNFIEEEVPEQPSLTEDIVIEKKR